MVSLVRHSKNQCAKESMFAFGGKADIVRTNRNATRPRRHIAAKETFDRALSATRKRHTHRLENEPATNVWNEGQIDVRNENAEAKSTHTK